MRMITLLMITLHLAVYSIMADGVIEDCGMAIVAAARDQIGKTVMYDSSYVLLTYPMGDIPIERGVCADVVVRALRDALGMDLQQLIHEDMRAAFLMYPRRWGFALPNRNIDHRRVINIGRYFKRKGFSVPISNKPEDYLPGDIVSCTLGSSIQHLMIVSDVKNKHGVPLIIHNINAGTREDDRLFAFPVTGHYRITQKGKVSMLTNYVILIGMAVAICACGIGLSMCKKFLRIRRNIVISPDVGT